MRSAVPCAPVRGTRIDDVIAMRKTLLACGFLSSLLYVAMNVFIAAQWPGYSLASGIVSELSAVDAPTRSLWVPFGFLYSALLLAFGYGVWSSAGDRRPLRTAGALLIAYSLVGVFWPPMHLRPVLAAGGGTLTDTLHIVWTFVTVVLMMLAMGSAAAAFGGFFRFYTTATIVLLMVCGWVTGTYAPAIQANMPTPLVGVWERIDIGLFMAWVVVFAAILLRSPASSVTAARQERLAA